MCGFFILTALIVLFIIPKINLNIIHIPKILTSAVTGFAAGFITAYVCFFLLPLPFEQTGIFFTLIFLSAGILTASFIIPLFTQIKLIPKLIKKFINEFFKNYNKSKKNIFIKLLFIILLIAIVILSPYNFTAALKFAAVSFIAGVLLSYSCSQIIPYDNTEIAAIFAFFGFITGVLLL